MLICYCRRTTRINQDWNTFRVSSYGYGVSAAVSFGS
jgi:hypothetical protein